MRNLLKKTTKYLTVVLVLFFVGGWHNAGHERITILAGKKLKGILPAFFTDNISQAAHCAVDPDVFKEKLSDKALTRAESPEHYFDLELFTGDQLPADRWEYARWCYEHDTEPGKTGTLPWALTEYTGKLTLAFAEYRKWPDNKNIQNKCLVYAGLLAHYAGDAGMPLHATVNHDGIIQPDGNKTGKGIHLKVDALVEKLPQEKMPLAAEIEILTFNNEVLPGIFEFIKTSNSKAGTLYELIDKIPGLKEPLTDTQVIECTQDALTRSVSLTSGLFKYAWDKSAEIKLPDWHIRQW